jgi:hypothetical protein
MEALAKFEAKQDPDFLAVATPGAGKTKRRSRSWPHDGRSSQGGLRAWS